MQFVVEATQNAGESASPWVEVRGTGGHATTRMTRRRPSWFGWGRFVRPIGTGDVLRYEIRGPSGELLETMFAKLDLDPPGKLDSIRPQTVPYRIYLRAARTGGATPGSRPIEVTVNRGKLPMARATLSIGESLPFEGHVLALPEWRPWIQFEMLSDSGIPLAVLAALLATAGLLLRAAARPSSRPGHAQPDAEPRTEPTA